MATLTASTGGGGRCLFATQPSTGLAPAGTFKAKIIDIVDKFKVERRKFESEEMEIVDLTQFRFGYRDADGKPWTIDSKQMKISGNEKSSLYGLLKSILGKAPKMGWDYCELKGTDVFITVEHAEGKSMTYANIVTVSPIPAGFGAAPAPKAEPAPKAATVDDNGTDGAFPF